MDQLVDAGLLEDLMARVDAGELQLTGEGGFLPGLIKAVLERGMAAELTDHLDYERRDPAGRGTSNSHNGSTPNSRDGGRGYRTGHAQGPGGQFRTAVSFERSPASWWSRCAEGPGSEGS